MDNINQTCSSSDYSSSSREKFSTKELSIHFFTIVLNGEPFIRYHIEVFKKLPFQWHWHIVEGVAKRIKDTYRSQGRSIDEFHEKGHSKDGTLSYIKDLAQQYPENVTVYMKENGLFWNGKLEMVNAPLKNIHEECLLWQVDVDEFWTPNQIIKARNLFLNHPEKTAAYYWCLFFVGVHLVITTRNGYAQNPTFEWLRTWKFIPGSHWKSHEPPQLVQTQGDDLAYINPFLHHETETENLVFQHFAYIRSEQIQFKEAYYGYKGAEEKWLKLQEQISFPIFLKDYFDWVDDNTMVNTIRFCEIIPLISVDSSGNIIFKDLSEFEQRDNFKFYNNQFLETVVPRTLARHQLDKLIKTIEAIENSKIWRIRSFVLKLLGKKDLDLSEYIENIAHEVIELQLDKCKLILKNVEKNKTWKIKKQWLKLKNLLSTRI